MTPSIPAMGSSQRTRSWQTCVQNAALKFIGPGGDVIRTMGNKAAARMLMRENRVPVVPGSDGPVRSLEQAAAVAGAVGYPVLVKALRRRRSGDAPGDAGRAARALCCRAGRGGGLFRVMGEPLRGKLILHPRHIEFDPSGQPWKRVHLGERDCSIQRKPEAGGGIPVQRTDADLRQAMGRPLSGRAQCARYQSAGTVEFVLMARRVLFYRDEHPDPGGSIP